MAKIKIEQLLRKCDRYFSQPDCDTGWDSSRNCWYHGYDLYMLVASDSAHDAMPYYEYCCRANITPFIDLNGKGGIKLPYKSDFTIGKDGVPVCKEGSPINHDGSEP